MIKLVAFDMDGVVFEKTNFWFELHKAFGTYEKGIEYTKKYIKTDYATLVELVVNGLWKGKSADEYFRLVKEAEYMPGAKETFKELKQKGIKTALISSGPSHLAQRAEKELGIDYVYTNELIIKDGVITGEFKWPIGHDKKVEVLKEICKKENISFEEVAAVGNDDNDIPKAKAVGLSIAFNTNCEELKQICDIMIGKKDLREILKHIK